MRLGRFSSQELQDYQRLLTDARFFVGFFDYSISTLIVGFIVSGGEGQGGTGVVFFRLFFIGVNYAINCGDSFRLAAPALVCCYGLGSAAWADQ